MCAQCNNDVSVCVCLCARVCVSSLADESHPSIYGDADTHLVPHPSFTPDLMVGSTGAAGVLFTGELCRHQRRSSQASISEPLQRDETPFVLPAGSTWSVIRILTRSPVDSLCESATSPTHASAGYFTAPRHTKTAALSSGEWQRVALGV